MKTITVSITLPDEHVNLVKQLIRAEHDMAESRDTPRIVDAVQLYLFLKHDASYNAIVYLMEEALKETIAKG